ncbi:Por secretion system C-terminal sorting domain-containing protein [Flaviramulus basaltis]|uniref:Por secretion system C-terminal sorting domain-containing protein n=1 Tax=Flaviramulus basaltis TaxID=369401 RepID=A0A1K2IRQ2_9FLAO|nr:alpha-amylase family glycosyl hydrolase [Flaviramulus basaltis]SFZ95117.1 Por secretion system C-terminal sorting domain-containing protein [Flaviramulus basaltis]
MKKIYLLFLLVTSFTYAQVTTAPAIPTEADVITIYFNAIGTELEGYTGDVYAHTGVVTTASTSNSDWKHVIGSWGNNTTQPKLTRTGSNTYQLVITPNIPTFYNTNTGEVVTDIAIVFRNSVGNAQSRPDIFIPIYAEGLNITLTNPSNQSVYDLNEIISINASSSVNADLELKVNNISTQTATNATSISTSYTFTSTGLHTIEAIASQNGDIKQDEISVYVKTMTQNQTIPSGVTKGFNDNGDGTVTFVLEAPNKMDIYLFSGFNNWTLNETYKMKKDGDMFWLTVPGLDPNTEYAYQYFIDYSIKVADPYSHKILDPDNDQYIPTSTYPSLMAYPTGETTGIVSTFKINETDYTWQNTSFTRPDKENLIIYEMLIRDFTSSSTYQDAITHLDYLQNLGITAIELMPVNEFEGNDSWGYNPSFYMALDKAYGTNNDLKAFVDECHLRGIAVITDVVFNHSYGQSPLLQMYWDSANNRPTSDSPYYNENHNLVDNTSAHWGYDFNHESTYTVNFFNDVLSFWMNEYKIDGFRFDFTKGFSNTIYTGANNWASAYDGDRIENLKAFADHVWANNPGNEAYVIFEHLSDNSEETELANYGIMLWGNLNHNFNQNTMGYSSEADVSWLSYQNRGWNEPHAVGYMESHDEERLMVKNLAYGNSNGTYDVTDLGTALDRQEAASVIFYGIPGPKMIWQFGELGYDKSINCAANINDGSCRLDKKPVAWTLDYDSDVNRLNLRDVTAKMISLKKQFPSTFNTDDYSLSVTALVKRINLNDNIGNLDVVIVANFDVTSQSVNPNFPTTGNWYETFSSTTINVTNPTATISLQPGEYRLYSQTENLSTSDFEANLSLKLFPNPSNTTFSINRNVEKLSIYNLSGKAVKTFNGNFNKGHLFNISSLPSSIYLIVIKNDLGMHEHIKFVKL